MVMIAGFDLPSSGAVEIGGRDMTRPLPVTRGIGMVFQSYAPCELHDRPANRFLASFVGGTDWLKVGAIPAGDGV